MKRPSKSQIERVIEAGESRGIYYVIEFCADGNTRFIPTDKLATLPSARPAEENNPWDE